MRKHIFRAAITILTIVAVSGGVVGCMPEPSEESRVAQLQGYIDRAEAWGGEIIAQIPEEEIEIVNPNRGGVREANDAYQPWPKLYFWVTDVNLLPEGARSPREVADDLDPWLENQGWQREESRELPPENERFKRHYFRQSYHLTVEVYTVEPPQAQSIVFRIVTPSTD